MTDHGSAPESFLAAMVTGNTFQFLGVPPLLGRAAWWGADLSMPTTIDAGETDPTAPFFSLLGHLKPGLTPKSAEPDLRILPSASPRFIQRITPTNSMSAWCR